MLEIGAGTGQHPRYFAELLPAWRWLPSEHPRQIDGLRAGLGGRAGGNLLPALPLDVEADWPEQRFDAAFSANTAHIMHWPTVEAMFAGVARVLKPDGQFVLYGPFMRGGAHTAPSNAAFDADLRQRDPGMGIRDLEDIDQLADRCGLARVAELAMPANNLLLCFRSPA